MIYSVPGPEVSIDQGDLIDDCPLYTLLPRGGVVDFDAAPAKFVQRVIVITQTCDLLQKKSPGATVALVHLAATAVERGLLKAQAVRDQVRRILVHGWYFLPAGPDPVALPECVIDFRDLHTVSRRVLEQLISDGKRAARVMPPYRDHLSQHFGNTYARIGLPEPYETVE